MLFIIYYSIDLELLLDYLYTQRFIIPILKSPWLRERKKTDASYKN
jgi:hypothetical protein